MRGQGRCRIVTLKRLASNDPIIWMRLRDILNNVMTASDGTWVVPAILGRVPIAQAGLAL